MRRSVLLGEHDDAELLRHHRRGLDQGEVVARRGAAFAGDMTTAADLLDLTASLGTEVDPWLEIHLRLLHGQMEVLTGNLVTARETLAEVERLARRLDSPFSLATVLNIQASFAKLAGEDDDALERLIEAAGLAAEVGL